ncbi:MAG: PepSY-like domain-containing protein [Alistipes sp.]|nr:PepSY-like domain-containing protein [Alistipes sp.]
MKKLFLLLLLPMLWIATARCEEKITTTDPTQLPPAAQTFLNTHFANTRVSIIKIEKEHSDVSYDVMLENGFKVEFNKKGQWTEIQGDPQDVPQSVIPTKIMEYVSANYPQAKIVDLEQDQKKIKLELANGDKIEFTSQGKFILYDKED